MMNLLRENIGLITIVVILAGLWLALRTTPTQFGPDSSLDTMLGSGQPVVVEFFGNR